VLVNGLLLVLGAVAGVLAARLLGPEGRGALALAIAVAGIMTVIVGLGLQQAFAYLVAARREAAGMAVGLAVWSAALVGGPSVALGWLLVLAFIEDETVLTVVSIGFLAVPGSVIAVNTAGILQGLRLGRRFNASRLVHPTAYCAGVVGAALFASSVTPAVLTSVYAVAATIGAVCAYRLLPPPLRRLPLPSRRFTSAALRYGASAGIGAAALAASTHLAVPFLGALAGLRETGFYAVGLSYAIPVTLFASAIAIHTLPDVAAAELRARSGLVRQRLTITFGTLVPIAVAAMLAAPLLVPAVFGENFRPAVAAAQILVLAQSFRAVAYVLADIGRGLGRPGVPSIAEVAGIVVTIALLPVVVPRFGSEGAAIVVATTTSAVAILMTLGIRKALRQPPPPPRPT
jgi:antigen flippase